MINFEVTHCCSDTGGRAGLLETLHGTVETPAFMPVGTQASVKSLEAKELHQLGFGIILANTYHLYLRPGIEIIARHGGLHNFMNWSGALLTDSGGFQVFSLQQFQKVSDQGIDFKSHLDGSSHFFTPEKAVRIQNSLGADIIMALDQCPHYPASREEVKEAVERSTIWAGRSQKAHLRNDQALFGIIQGGIYRDLREKSAEEILALDFPGYAIGGLSVGEPKELMYQVLDYTVPWLPREKPRYLMGVGSPDALYHAVCRGVDLFDCVLPTRMARNGRIMTGDGYINLRNSAYATDTNPLDFRCRCYTCLNYSRSYLRHLLVSGEITGHRLITYHNLFFLKSFMEKMRTAIKEGNLQHINGVWNGDT